ncbi:MAG: HAMP domain-containing histidine kinase [Ruminococcus sp.]|nr:HAMP domain-containing histidine kinase [Ruminococcus sp.]
MKRRLRRPATLHSRLLWYFLLFGAIILVVLWVFQSFLLKPYYTSKKSKIVEQSGARIVKAIEQNKNIWTTIDSVASYNSLTVCVYGTESVMGFASPIYEINYDNPAAQLTIEAHEVNTYYRNALNNGGTYMTVDSNSVADIARQKIDRLRKAFTGASDDSAAPEVHYKSSTAGRVENMVYAAVAAKPDGEEMFVLVTSSITPLSNTLDILQGQLLWVSVAFIILSLIFSIFASRRIAKPISKTNTAAKELAKKNYAVDFNARGYLEVEELNDTLNYAKTELAATEKLQRELIANISHDLRTPLTMITGYAEVMRDLPGENTPENIQIIIDEATRLSTLVNDLLDLSKLQSGALQAEKKVFSLTDSIRAIFTRYAKLVEQDGYNIVFEAGENVLINADELRMSQVVYNLMNNAVNHVGEDKTVIVTQSVVKGKARIEITDHGEGIPADKLEYIWDRYYKVDKEHRRGVIGSGLGLSIVKTILDAHNARYGVRSTPGKGSTFWFEIAAVRTEK